MSERLRDVRQMSDSELEEPRGVGGWLTVFAVLLALQLLNSGFALFNGFLPTLISPESRDFGGSEALLNETLFAVFNWYLVIGMAIVLALGMLSLITLFMQDRRFPILAVSYVIANASFWVVEAIFSYAIFRPLMTAYRVEWTVMSGPIIFAVIWIAYFQKSKRMRNTFKRESDPQQIR